MRSTRYGVPCTIFSASRPEYYASAPGGPAGGDLSSLPGRLPGWGGDPRRGDPRVEESVPGVVIPGGLWPVRDGQHHDVTSARSSAGLSIGKHLGQCSSPGGEEQDKTPPRGPENIGEAIVIRGHQRDDALPGPQETRGLPGQVVPHRRPGLADQDGTCSIVRAKNRRTWDPRRLQRYRARSREVCWGTRTWPRPPLVGRPTRGWREVRRVVVTKPWGRTSPGRDNQRMRSGCGLQVSRARFG